MISLLLFYLIHSAHSTGEWYPCSTDNLALAEQDVINMDSEIRQLFQDNSVTITDDDTITINSCQSQVVSGTNYRLNTNFGRIQYYVALATDPDRVHRVPTSFEYLGPSPSCICTMIYAPVCYMGNTYGNECMARCAGATNGTFTSGECDSGTGTITGGYSAYTNLTTIQTQVNTIKTNIISLLQGSGLDISDNALIVVISAQSQVVAGVNYRVTIDVGCYTDVVIQYYVDLDGNINTNCELIDAGDYRSVAVGSYQSVTDLSGVTETVSNIKSDIEQLLISQGLPVSDDIVVVSAQEQVVAGMNYMVTINVGSLYTNMIIKYYIGLDENDQSPQDLEIVSLGDGSGVIVGGWSNVDDLAYTQAIVNSMHDQIVSLLQDNDVSVDSDAEIVVVAAQSQVVAGTNYRVTMNVGCRVNVMVQYYIGVPIIVQGAPVVTPTHLVLIDGGIGYEDVLPQDLDPVRLDVMKVESDLRQLFVTAGILTENDRSTIIVVSAQQQIVSGTNYKVKVDVGMYENVIIKFYVPLVTTDPNQVPTDIALLDSGSETTNMYQDITDEAVLEQVREDVKGIEHAIILVLSNEGVGIADDADITVEYAQSQEIDGEDGVVIGSNYKVTMNIGDRQDVTIQYYIPVTDGTPQQLALISAGSVPVSEGMGVAKTNQMWIILSIVLALVIIGFVIGYSVWYKKKKGGKREERYATLNEQEMSVTDAV